MKSPANVKEKKQEERDNLRKPTAAGKFYPSSAIELKRQINEFVDPLAVKQDVIGCVLPHAGYIYSGRVAVQTVSHIKIKDRVILLGPNHTGDGREFSIVTKGAWQTPLGQVKIDEELSRELLNKSRYIEEDNLGHLYEHSLEVELPVLQYFRSDFKLTPIAILSDQFTPLGWNGELNKLKRTGENIGQGIIDMGIKDSVMLVASSDMTHYEPQADAERKDKIAIQSMLELDQEKLFENIHNFNITMCGYAPVIVMLGAAKLLGAKTARLIKYQTSGDVTGDRQSVVGYAGIVII